MNNQLQFIRDMIYGLKRNYGVPLQIYNILDVSTNLETGQKSISKTVYKIQRAVLLPRTAYNDTITLTGLSRKFNSGNVIDKQKRTILIDSKDYPANYKISPKDYVVIAHNRYDIITAENYDHNLAVILTVQKIEGEEVAAIVDENLKDSIVIGQGVHNG